MPAHLHDFQEETDSQEEKGGKSQKQTGPWSLLFALPLFRQAQLMTQKGGTNHWTLIT